MDFFIFTEEILNGKLHFLCNVRNLNNTNFTLLKRFTWHKSAILVTEKKNEDKDFHLTIGEGLRWMK